MLIDGSHPFIQKLTLGAVLLVILAFDFEHQGRAILQADKVIGVESVQRALVGEVDHKAQVVILDPGSNNFIIVLANQFVGFAGFPSGVKDHAVDMGFAGKLSGASGVPAQAKRSPCSTYVKNFPNPAKRRSS